MKKSDVETAKAEAEKFIRLCDDCLNNVVYADSPIPQILPGRHPAALKRSSMDLSQALIVIRRG